STPSGTWSRCRWIACRRTRPPGRRPHGQRWQRCAPSSARAIRWSSTAWIACPHPPRSATAGAAPGVHPAPRKESDLMTDSKSTTRLQQLIHRTDRVLAVMHAPTAAHARIMELAGAEVAFVGTSGVVGTYTGLADVGVATMTECLTIAGWIAQSVRF